MIFGIYKVSGHSMMPSLKPNDRVFVSSIPYFFSKPKIGDVVVFRYNDKPRAAAARGKTLIKRIVKISNRKFFVEGDNKKDTLETESIRKEEILGKVIFRI